MTTSTVGAASMTVNMKPSREEALRKAKAMAAELKLGIDLDTILRIAEYLDRPVPPVAVSTPPVCTRPHSDRYPPPYVQPQYVPTIYPTTTTPTYTLTCSTAMSAEQVRFHVKHRLAQTQAMHNLRTVARRG